MEPTAGPDTVEQREIFCLRRESNPDRPAGSPPLYRLNYSGSSIVDLIVQEYTFHSCQMDRIVDHFLTRSWKQTFFYGFPISNLKSEYKYFPSRHSSAYWILNPNSFLFHNFIFILRAPITLITIMDDVHQLSTFILI